MRKTLLIAASALAASVISSQAQVYSQNIVGYVNQTLPTGFTLISNPLDASGGNNITNVFSTLFAGTFDGSKLNIWNGHSYAVYTIDSTVASGVADAGDVNPVYGITLDPGKAIFFQNAVGAVVTNTYVGTVHVDGAGASTNVVGVTTNLLTSSPVLTLASSKIPVGGGISSVLKIPADGSLDGCKILIPNIVAGSVHGYTTTTIDSTVAGGFADAGDVNPVAEPLIPVGSGFFFNNGIGAPVNWVQSF